MRIDFLGATSTVTGSKYLLTHAGRRLLVDCGLFQGLNNCDYATGTRCRSMPPALTRCC